MYHLVKIPFRHGVHRLVLLTPPSKNLHRSMVVSTCTHANDTCRARWLPWRANFNTLANPFFARAHKRRKIRPAPQSRFDRSIFIVMNEHRNYLQQQPKSRRDYVGFNFWLAVPATCLRRFISPVTTDSGVCSRFRLAVYREKLGYCLLITVLR